ncbi:hypothetical protein EI555_010838, partial [Monodon monoceros]
MGDNLGHFVVLQEEIFEQMPTERLASFGDVYHVMLSAYTFSCKCACSYQEEEEYKELAEIIVRNELAEILNCDYQKGWHICANRLPRLPKVPTSGPTTRHPQRHSEAPAILSRLPTPCAIRQFRFSPWNTQFLPVRHPLTEARWAEVPERQCHFSLLAPRHTPSGSCSIQRPTQFKFVHFRLQPGRRAQLRPLKGGARGDAGEYWRVSCTGATPIAGRFTPGTFMNHIQEAFREPRFLVITDPRGDHQPLTEASYVNLPTIALCNTDSPLWYVDIAIPCNNKGAHSVGLMWWMLAREVLRVRGTIFCEQPWEVMSDLYFYRDPEEIEKEEQVAAEKAVTKEEFQGEWTALAPEFTAAQPEVAEWSEDFLTLIFHTVEQKCNRSNGIQVSVAKFAVTLEVSLLILKNFLRATFFTSTWVKDVVVKEAAEGRRIPILVQMRCYPHVWDTKAEAALAAGVEWLCVNGHPAMMTLTLESDRFEPLCFVA